MAFKMKGFPFTQKDDTKTTKFFGRERTVSKDKHGTKTVTVKKKAKDGEVKYRTKSKRKKDGKLISKVKGKGTYSTDTGHDIEYTGKVKKGRRGTYEEEG